MLKKIIILYLVEDGFPVVEELVAHGICLNYLRMGSGFPRQNDLLQLSLRLGNGAHVPDAAMQVHDAMRPDSPTSAELGDSQLGIRDNFESLQATGDGVVDSVLDCQVFGFIVRMLLLQTSTNNGEPSIVGNDHCDGTGSRVAS